MYHNPALRDAAESVEQSRKDNAEAEPLSQKSIDALVEIVDEDKRIDREEKKEM